jgi:hypothetical protein
VRPYIPGKTVPASQEMVRDASPARKADALWYIDGVHVRVAGPPGELIEHDADVASWFRPRHGA